MGLGILHAQCPSRNLRSIPSVHLHRQPEDIETDKRTLGSLLRNVPDASSLPRSDFKAGNRWRRGQSRHSSMGGNSADCGGKFHLLRLDDQAPFIYSRSKVDSRLQQPSLKFQIPDLEIAYETVGEFTVLGSDVKILEKEIRQLVHLIALGGVEKRLAVNFTTFH